MHVSLGVATLIRSSILVLCALVFTATSRPLAASSGNLAKLDPLLQSASTQGRGYTPVIVRTVNGNAVQTIQPVIGALGGTLRRALPGIGGQAAVVPNAALVALASNPFVESVSLDRVVVGAMERTAMTIGAAAIRQELGYDGAGIGVAVIDSGVAASHDDLLDHAGASRVERFVDLINDRQSPYDDYGHGTHVAGIVAGNGFDSNGARTGIAPAVRLTVIKVLDGSGRGRISDVIAALDYVVAHRDELNIRIVNLSIAAGVYQSYLTDPLTLATERAVNAGIVVIAAAGNNGVSPAGVPRYRGITAPGNAPWVLTVGGSSHMGTIIPSDDTMADFSSRGPGAIDHAAKPDVVAAAVGIESLAAPNSELYTSLSAFLLNGTVPTAYMPYLSMSGTSMAAPTVTGTVALILQANPALTPNAVKAILQYTAEVRSKYDPLTQGAGFLNAKGAVQLAKFFAASKSTAYPDSAAWSRRIIWGNYSIKNGRLAPTANAWSADVIWGATVASTGHPIEWGVLCGTASCDTTSGPWRWSGDNLRNVVWGPLCGGANCTTTWTVTALSEGDTVVWGTGEGDTVVWGTSEGETVVWGTNDAETVVWGTNEGDTVVWGTNCASLSCSPTIWGNE